MSLGYSFNRTGAALTLTTKTPVYLKCAPQSDGSAIMDSSTPIVQTLPSTADGKIYIFLGIAYSATNIELIPQHPVYYHDGTAIRIWIGGAIPAAIQPATATPVMDGTAAVGTSAKYAREDHVHPSDTTKADVNSPSFTGDPKAPTPAILNNSTSIATTAWVNSKLSNAIEEAKSVKYYYVVPDGQSGWSGQSYEDVTFYNGVICTDEEATSPIESTEDLLNDINAGKLPVLRVADPDGQYVYCYPSWLEDDNAILSFYGLEDVNGNFICMQIIMDVDSLHTTCDGGYLMSMSPATETPIMDGTAAVGTSAKYAREDHVHPSDSTKAPVAQFVEIDVTADASWNLTLTQQSLSELSHINNHIENNDIMSLRLKSGNDVLWSTRLSWDGSSGLINPSLTTPFVEYPYDMGYGWVRVYYNNDPQTDAWLAEIVPFPVYQGGVS